MVNASSVSRTNPHFFQPLLPGFQSHLKMPVKFFSKHMEGKHEGFSVNLRTDASERTWKVRMEGNRLTDGWKEFVEAHDLRIGDFLVFRHQGDMLFHVTALGPSFCEIQFSQSRSHEEDEESDEIDSRSEEEVEENEKTESHHSLSDLNCFSQYVTASNLSRDRVVVPIGFVKRNGLNKEQEIVLMNEEGKSWASELKGWGACRVFIVRGWTSFCTANKLEVGDSCSFRLLPNTETPVFQLCSRTKAERKNKILSAEDCINDRTGVNRFVKLTPTSGSLHYGKQHLPVNFTRENGLINPGKIILVDKNRAEWSMKLKVDRRCGTLYIISGSGWKSFCAANNVGAGESLILELVRGGVSPLLKFSSKMKQPPDEAEARAHKRARAQRLVQETGPKLETREKITEEGEPSRASSKSSGNNGDLQHTQSCSVSYQVTKVKQSVVDTLTSMRRFRAELETMERRIEDSLQEISNLATERGEDNGNKKTSSSEPGETPAKGQLTSEKQSTLPLPTEDAPPKDLNLSADMYTALRELRAALVKEASDGVMSYQIFTNSTLYQISRRIPRTKEELLKINGLGKVKVSMYGDRLLERIESTVNEYYGTNRNDSIISNVSPDSGKRRRDKNISPTNVAE